MQALKRPLLLCASLLCFGFPRAARADGRDPAAADVLFQQARDAMARGELATACARFAESQRLDPAPGTLLNVAQCEEKAGKLASSYAHLNEVLEALPKDDFRVAYVRSALAALKPRIPTVTVTLAKGSEGARVTRDDLELRVGSFGVPLPVDPGPHVFVVRAGGRRDARQEVTFGEGQQASLVLSAGSLITASPAPPEDGPGPSRTMAVGAFAVGGAGLVTGIVTGLMFADAASTYHDHCDASGCDPEGLSAASRGKTLNVVSPIAFGVGALGIGVGTYLLLTSKRAAPRQGSLVVNVNPLVSPQIAGLMMTAGF